MDGYCTVRRTIWALASVWVVLSAAVAAAAPDPDGNGVGVYLTFDEILERRRAELAGTRLAINPNLYIQHAWTSSPIEPEYIYSPELDTVFEVSGPAYFPEEPRSYLYDGAYYVYEPASLDIPGIELAARPAGFHQQRMLETTRAELFQRARARGIGALQEGSENAGFEIQVLPAMPEFMQGLVGRGATNIRVTGRESITFAGESRRVKPFIRTEQGSGQSLFPRLNMDQDLQVKLDGTVGDKVHVQVDHNSNAFGLDANRIQVWYEGYEDDIIRRIDLGGTNLTLPGSNLGSFGGGQGLFGVKSDLRLGSLDLTVVAAKQESEAETRTLTPTGGSSTPVQIDENRYARDRFFFYEKPSLDVALYDTYGLDTNALFDENLLARFEVFIDDQQSSTETERNYRGYAVEGMPAAPTDADTSQFWSAYLNHPQGNAARWPSVDPANPDSTFKPGLWRRLDPAEIGVVYFQVSGTRHVLGFFLRNRSLDSDDVLAVSFVTPDGLTVGTIDEDTGGAPWVRLRLLRHPNQDVSFDDHPTSIYMMRHVYVLPATQVSNLEVKIVSHAPGDQDPDIPNRVSQTTYLHMYGLDAVDAANQPTPDGLFDQSRVNLWDPEEGFLYLPGLRPFSPPSEIVQRRLEEAGIGGADPDSVFGQDERLPVDLYTLPRNDANIPGRKFALEVRTTGTETEITLPQDIIEGSEEVRLDGRVLQAGVDYDIEPFAGGKITLKGEVLKEITPASRIEVKYDYRPLVGSGQATMYGATGQYKFGQRGRLSSTWLFESRRAFTDRPRLGEEPTRTLVGDLNGSLGFNPRFLTRLVDLLPFTRTSAASTVNLTAETAISVPNPNTRNNAYVDDLESAEDSDVFGLSRNNWYWASIPFDLVDARADTLLRVPLAYYNPVGEVKRGHLNPELDEREADDGVTVLELGFNHAAAEAVAQNPPPGTDMTLMWSGVMTSFGGAGLDFTQTKTIEFWLNDGVGVPTQRFGRMHFDFGTLSEDFVFFENNPNRAGGALSDPDFNREAETRSEFRAQFDDLGWNGIDEDCDAYSDEEEPPPGSDCHVPSLRNDDQQHAWANGTEDNNEFDTEDINGNGRFDLTNSFFRYTLDLADLTWVVTDVQPEYGEPGVPNEFEGWRKYRVDFDVIRDQLESIARQGASAPSLRQVRALRIWFEDPNAADPTATLFHHDIQIYDLKFTGSQWLQLGVFQTDGGQVAPEPGEAFSIGVINNKDDPSYVLPPGNTDINEEGVQSREQSLRLNFTNLMPEHEMVVQRTLNVAGAGLDFTDYRRLSYLVYYPRAPSDSAEFFFRVGTDSLNFYEVAHTVPGPRDWSEISVDLDSLTQLKFPTADDEFTEVILGGQPVRQVRSTIPDAQEPSVRLRITRRGEPSLKAVTRLFVGVRHPVYRVAPPPDPGGEPPGPKEPEWSPGAAAGPLRGEVWFNNVRLENVERTVGLAQSYSGQAKIADVADVSGSVSLRDADFRGLRQRTGSGVDALNVTTRVSSELSRLVPTLGFNIPVSYNYANNVTKPKWFSQSDTRNNEVQKFEQRTDNTRRSFAISATKRPSRFWLFKPTLDRLSFSYNETRDQSRTFTQRDRSSSYAQSINYDISPAPRTIPIWPGVRLNLMPTNLKLSASHQSSRSVSFLVRRLQDLQTGAFRDSLVLRPTSPQRSFNWNGSTALRPLQSLSARYNFSEPRNYRDAHPINNAERFTVLGFDVGIPTGRSESFALDFTPRLFRFSYTSNYSDRRIASIGSDQRPEPDAHTVSNSRARRLSFDFGVHRRIGRWGWLRDPNAPAPAGGAAAGTRRPEGAPQAAAPADTTAAAPAQPKRPRPNPLKMVLRWVASIDPIKVELSDGHTASYTGLANEAGVPFRFGLSLDSGVIGARYPTPLDERRTIELGTAIPLRGALRVSTRYLRSSNDRQSRAGTGPTLKITRTPSVETTFPSLDMTINNLEKLPIWAKRMTRSSLSLGYSRATTESKTQELDASERLLRESNPRLIERTTITSNWTGQWKRDVSTNVAFSHSDNVQEVVGRRNQQMRRSINGGLRFKISPEGGLRLPLLGLLKTGLDLSFNGSWSADENRTFTDRARPDYFVLQNKVNQLLFSTRGDYTLSRNMSGGLEVGMTRTSRNDLVKQTITTVRLAFNLIFSF